MKVLNEGLYFLWYHTLLEARDQAELRTRVIDVYRAEHGPFQWDGDTVFFAEDVNSPDVVEFLKSHQPDICFAMCLSSYFKKEIRNVPKYGTFLWHEGITPEYKGLYAPFWAIHNLDFERLGCTLLKMDAHYDAGDIFVQGPVWDVDPFRHQHGYIGHKAVIDTLPAVEAFLGDVEQGVARPIRRENATSTYYTYPGITNYLVQRWRLWWHASRTKSLQQRRLS